MGLMRRQSSQPGSYYNGGHDSPEVPDAYIFQRSVSDMSNVSMYEDDPEVSMGSFVNDKIDNKYESKSSDSLEKSSGINIFIILQYIVFAFVAFDTFKTHGTVSKTYSDLEKAKVDLVTLEQVYFETQREVKDAHQDFDKLKNAFASAKNVNIKIKEDREEITEIITEQHEFQYEFIEILQEHIQDYHYNELLEM